MTAASTGQHVLFCFHPFFASSADSQLRIVREADHCVLSGLVWPNCIILRHFVVQVMKSLTEEEVLGVLGKVLPLDSKNAEVRQALADVARMLVGRRRLGGNFLAGFVEWVAEGKVRFLVCLSF